VTWIIAGTSCNITWRFHACKSINASYRFNNFFFSVNAHISGWGLVVVIHLWQCVFFAGPFPVHSFIFLFGSTMCYTQVSCLICFYKCFSHMCISCSLYRLGEPEDCAGIVSFLCSDDASYITGETILVTGGMPVRL